MNDTNYIGSIVKILETPRQQIIQNNINVTKFRAQLPQLKSTKIVHLTFWGYLAQDVTNYYKINDYILIEGYLSLRNKKLTNSSFSTLKKIDITVLRIYPFLINSNQSI